MGHYLAFYLTKSINFDVTYMNLVVIFNVNGTCVIHTFCLTVHFDQKGEICFGGNSWLHCIQKRLSACRGQQQQSLDATSKTPKSSRKLN